MTTNYINNLFCLDDKVAVVIGAGGHLCSAMAIGLARAGAAIAVLDLRLDKALKVADEISKFGGNAIVFIPIHLILIPP